MSVKRKKASSRKGKRNMNQKNMIVVIIVLGMLGMILGPMIVGGNLNYKGGWETNTSIDSVRVNGETFSETRLPDNYNSWGDKFVKFDADDPMEGLPDVIVTTTAPREYVMDGFGEWTVAVGGDTFDSIQKSVGEDMVFFWDHHVFFFEVYFEASPDYEGGAFGYAIGEAKDMDTAKAAQVTAMIRFETDDWVSSIVEILKVENSTFELAANSVWTGIMSASVVEHTTGVVSGASDPNSGFEAYADQNAMINMEYTDDGIPTNDITFYEGQKTVPITNVPDKVNLELSCELLPGYTDTRVLWMGGIDTSAVFVNYRIRVDVLTTAGYTLQDGDLEDRIAVGDKYKSEANDDWEDFLQWLGGPFSLFGLEFEAGSMIWIMLFFAAFIVIVVMLFKTAMVRFGVGGLKSAYEETDIIEKAEFYEGKKVSSTQEVVPRKRSGPGFTQRQGQAALGHTKKGMRRAGGVARSAPGKISNRVKRARTNRRTKKTKAKRAKGKK